EWKMLFAKDFVVRGEPFSQTGYQRAVYTDDLTLRAVDGTDLDPNERALVVTRLADGKELFRKATADLRITDLALSPDGKYMIAGINARPGGAPAPQPAVTRTVLWKVDGGPKPVWEREDEHTTRFGNGFVLDIRRFAFAADGKTVSDYFYSFDG